jgi:hypothetical protein
VTAHAEKGQEKFLRQRDGFTKSTANFRQISSPLPTTSSHDLQPGERE